MTSEFEKHLLEKVTTFYHGFVRKSEPDIYQNGIVFMSDGSDGLILDHLYLKNLSGLFDLMGSGNGDVINLTTGVSQPGYCLKWVDGDGHLVTDTNIREIVDGHSIDDLLVTDTEGGVVRMDTIFPLVSNNVQVLGSKFHNGIEVFSSIGIPPSSLSDLLWRRSIDNHLMHNNVDLEGFGNMFGPNSSTDNAIVRFDLATGKLVQNSGVLINDSNDISGSRSITFVPTISNPGGINTLWIDNSNNRLMYNNSYIISSDYNVVNVSTTPYNVTSNDYFIAVSTSSLAITINLPSASIKKEIYIADASGNAPINNITIVPNFGDSILISGLPIINTTYGYFKLLSDGVSSWYRS